LRNRNRSKIDRVWRVSFTAQEGEPRAQAVGDWGGGRLAKGPTGKLWVGFEGERDDRGEGGGACGAG